MKILFLALYPPYPPVDGGRLRTFNILKQVARKHEVCLVCMDDPLSRSKDHHVLQGICKNVIILKKPSPASRDLLHKLVDMSSIEPVGLKQWESKVLFELLSEHVKGNEFQLAHIDHILLAQFAPSIAPLPWVITHHNIEALAQTRYLTYSSKKASLISVSKRIEISRWRRYEIKVSRNASAVVAVSELEAQYFQRYVPKKKVFLVTNGVDLDYYSPVGRFLDTPTLLFTGRMDYPPNVDAILWFYNKIWPLVLLTIPNLRLLIVGRDPTLEIQSLSDHEKITVTGMVEDVRPYFAQATIFIVPLRSGGGTRLKILEALAMGIPVVSTSLGSEGLDLMYGSDILVADEPQSFARKILELLASPALHQSVGERGRQVAVKKYSWEKVSQDLEAAYNYAIRFPLTTGLIG